MIRRGFSDILVIAIFDDMCHKGIKNADNCKIGIRYAINERFSYMLVEQINVLYQK